MPTLAASDDIRLVEERDVDAIKEIIEATEMFPPSMLDEMIAGFFSGRSRDFWLTIEREDRPAAVAYCAPEKMTKGTWNLLLLAALPVRQGTGLGSTLVAGVEERLRLDGQALLLVETSGTPEFERTRRFYRKLDFVEEARIRDFYASGDDKVVFWKRLASD
jgi:ribosomal protein S18 acetylase RimI-like enzyme